MQKKLIIFLCFFITPDLTAFADEKSQAIKDEIEFYKTAEAGKKGEEEAQYKLGNYYKTGEIVTQDTQQAEQWYLKAAQQGDYQAMII